MDPDAPRDLGFADPPLEESRRLHAPPFQFHAIPFDTSWMSHAPEYTRFTGVCHYVL